MHSRAAESDMRFPNAARTINLARPFCGNHGSRIRSREGNCAPRSSSRAMIRCSVTPRPFIVMASGESRIVNPLFPFNGGFRATATLWCHCFTAVNVSASIRLSPRVGRMCAFMLASVSLSVRPPRALKSVMYAIIASATVIGSNTRPALRSISQNHLTAAVCAWAIMRAFWERIACGSSGCVGLSAVAARTDCRSDKH